MKKGQHLLKVDKIEDTSKERYRIGLETIVRVKSSRGAKRNKLNVLSNVDNLLLVDISSGKLNFIDSIFTNFADLPHGFTGDLRIINHKVNLSMKGYPDTLSSFTVKCGHNVTDLDELGTTIAMIKLDDSNIKSLTKIDHGRPLTCESFYFPFDVEEAILSVINIKGIAFFNKFRDINDLELNKRTIKKPLRILIQHYFSKANLLDTKIALIDAGYSKYAKL
ncbi:MAG: hypothetical protein QXN55_01105 [Candidatus Nitrosotenuis sp.]